MDIKIVKNFQDGVYSPVNEQFMLQVIDHNYALDTFTGKQYFVFNPATNERFEIAPEVHKFDLAQIYYAYDKRDYLIFTSAKNINESEVCVAFYKYSLLRGVADIIYEKTVTNEELRVFLRWKVFVLDDNYCIFQMEYGTKTANGNFCANKRELILRQITEGKEILLNGSAIAKFGVETLLPVEGNVCVLKIGSPVLADNLFASAACTAEEGREMIGLINVKQFISELLLNKDNGFLLEFDRSSENVTFPYVRCYGTKIVYSKIDIKKRLEEVTMYYYTTEVKKVRMNRDIEMVSDLSHTYLMNDTPYILRNSDGHMELLNLDTHKTDIAFDENIDVKFILQDYIVTERVIRHGLLKQKETSYIEVFHYEDMEHPIFSTKALYRNCMAFYDDLIIFTN